MMIGYLLPRGVFLCGLFSGGRSDGIVDAAVYHWLSRRGYLTRSNGSNVAGAAADSLLFPTIAFGGFLPHIVALQFAAKVVGGFVWSVVLRSSQGTRKLDADRELWFAWRPVRLTDGRMAWLREVEREYRCGGCSLYGDCWYVYRRTAA